MAYFFFSPLVAYGVMAILYPLVQLDNFLSLFNCHFHFFFFKVAGASRKIHYFCCGTNWFVFQFVLTATASGAEEVISSKRRSWKGAGFGRLPIFYVADALSWVIHANANIYYLQEFIFFFFAFSFEFHLMSMLLAFSDYYLK